MEGDNYDLSYSTNTRPAKSYIGWEHLSYIRMNKGYWYIPWKTEISLADQCYKHN